MARRSTEYVQFLRRLRQARTEAGLSQAEAARRLGKPQSFVSKCESGERRVDYVELRMFVRLYGVPMTFFDEDRNVTVRSERRWSQNRPVVGMCLLQSPRSRGRF